MRNERALGIRAADGHVTGVDTQRGDGRLPRRRFVYGGMSYPATGSRGDGYRLAAALGHHITELRPSLVPLISDDTARNCRACPCAM